VRIGLHTGEAIRDSGKFFGKTVIQAYRIADEARAEEILVSSLLDDLTESAGDLRFDDGREAVLHGLSGTHRLYAVCWTCPPAVADSRVESTFLKVPGRSSRATRRASSTRTASA
jgi:class 3 adenylate cyclase